MKHLIMLTEHAFDVHCVGICLICIQVLMGLWLCALFCPQRMWGFDPAIYISFFFLSTTAFSLFIYIQYEVYFSLLNFVVLEMLYGMLQ